MKERKKQPPKVFARRAFLFLVDAVIVTFSFYFALLLRADGAVEATWWPHNRALLYHNLPWIVAVYLACFLAGLVAGKKAKRRRFLWGFCAGALYFLIFLALSFAIRQSLKETASSLLLSFALCAGSGTIGGMFS